MSYGFHGLPIQWNSVILASKHVWNWFNIYYWLRKNKSLTVFSQIPTQSSSNKWKVKWFKYSDKIRKLAYLHILLSYCLASASLFVSFRILGPTDLSFIDSKSLQLVLYSFCLPGILLSMQPQCGGQKSSVLSVHQSICFQIILSCIIFFLFTKKADWSKITVTWSSSAALTKLWRFTPLLNQLSVGLTEPP